MGCSNSTQGKNGVVTNKPGAKGTLLGADPTTGADLKKPAAAVVGSEFDTPYGKGKVEELKQGENGLSYAIVKLSSGFVSVPQQVADAWHAESKRAPLLKVGSLELNAVLETPYGSGILETLKRAEFDENQVFAIVALQSGFVSVPVETAEAWAKSSSPVLSNGLEAEKEVAAPKTVQEKEEKEQSLPEPAAAPQQAEKAEEQAALEPPFPAAAQESPLDEADLQAEVINTASGPGGLLCGQVAVAKCGCADGFEKPQTEPIAA